MLFALRSRLLCNLHVVLELLTVRSFDCRDSHGLKQALSCQCPWVAGGAGTQKATGLVKAESFLHDTQYEWLCPGPSQRARQQPRGLGAVLYHCTDQKKGRPKH